MAQVEAAPLAPSADKLSETQAAISQYDFIRFTTTDMNGILRGYLYPADLAAKSLKSGISFAAALHASGPTMRVNPEEVRERHYCNMTGFPDLDTLHAVPWVHKYRVGQIMVETFWDSTTPQEACTRNMARRMLSKLDNMGLKFYSGSELEFVLFDQKTQLPVYSHYRPLSMQIQAEYEPWFYDVATNMKEAGVSVGSMHLETNQGHFEFTTQPRFGIEAVDGAVKLKQGIKEMAIQRGWLANFMTVPFFTGETNSGETLNFSVWQKASVKNAFWDESTEDNISEFGKHWIAGMLYHAKALTALCNNTTNCYRGLHLKVVPHQANWGIENRQAILRVKNNAPASTYIENRHSTSLSNPYLVMAATIAAGLDGLTKKLPCPAPHDVSEAVHLPNSLKEALDCLQENSVMVEALGATFVKWFVQTKTEADLKLVEGITDAGELLELERQQYAPWPKRCEYD